MSKQSARYSEAEAHKANLNLTRLGLASWGAVHVKALQKKVKVKKPDGWFGPKSIKNWKKWARTHDINRSNKGKETHIDDPKKPVLAGQVIIHGVGHTPPAGVKFVNHLEKGGVPAQLNDTSPRKMEPTQFVFHRGTEVVGKWENGNYARSTERILDDRGLSGTFSQDVDGTIYQHFDVGPRRGRHATHHNVQSDSLDVAGPFTYKKRKPVAGQVKHVFQAAIGRNHDGKPPLARKYSKITCWTMTQAQIDVLIAFIPWYCKLRGIPLTGCSDWRCMRLSSGGGRQDPVTNVKGLLAHAQISGPGRRVDGIVALEALFEAGESTGIKWRTGEEFFDT